MCLFVTFACADKVKLGGFVRRPTEAGEEEEEEGESLSISR